jgi:hypothetical protein
MYDLTRLRYSLRSIFVLAYPTILMSLGRNLLRYCGCQRARTLLRALPYQAEECWECLLLCQISGSSEYDDDGILLELQGAVTGFNQHVDSNLEKRGER